MRLDDLVNLPLNRLDVLVVASRLFGDRRRLFSKGDSKSRRGRAGRRKTVQMEIDVVMDVNKNGKVVSAVDDPDGLLDINSLVIKDPVDNSFCGRFLPSIVESR